MSLPAQSWSRTQVKSYFPSCSLNIRKNVLLFLQQLTCNTTQKLLFNGCSEQLFSFWLPCREAKHQIVFRKELDWCETHKRTHTQTPGEIQGVFAGARWLGVTFWSSAPRWGPSRCRSELLRTPTSRRREIHAVEWQLARASPPCVHSESGAGQYNTHSHNIMQEILSARTHSSVCTSSILHCYSHYSLAKIWLQRQATRFMWTRAPD